MRAVLTRRGPLDAQTAVVIASQVARALDRAHERGVIHRDIKPENIFVSVIGGETFVKVLDFGIASAAEK